MRRFPNARLAAEGEGESSFRPRRQQDDEREHGPVWDQVIMLLSGLSADQINELGGYRVYETVVRTLYESAAAS